MSQIVLKNINKYYDNVHVLKDLDLVVEEGDFMTLLGPSGCGKTTTLRVISGLENPQSGIITMDGKEIVNSEMAYFTPPSKRNLNLVFQSYALWPHMTVFENVAFGLTIKKIPKNQVSERVKNALMRMHIEEFEERYPNELSGGQQQRVAIARAIVSEPKILLLDEPLSNLDAKLRIEMRSELKRLHRELKTTLIYVTHDQVEALTMSTKIAIFFEGRLLQVDTPMGIYKNPVDVRVADFIGNPKINFIEGDCRFDGDSASVKCVLGNLIFDKVKEKRDVFEKRGIDFVSISSKVVLALRPEHIIINREPVENGIECKIYSALPAGSETLTQLNVNGTSIMAKTIGQTEYGLDQKVWITIPLEKINIYDKETGRVVLGAI
jgi:multiple sugar transport system ATP-binding protein